MTADERSGTAGTESTRACPTCGHHTLALERPPHISVAGAQPYTEVYRMGDLPMPVGVRCRSCGAWWQTVEALEAGEPGSSEAIESVDGLDTPSDGPDPREDRSGRPSGVTVATIAAGAALAVTGFLELAFIVVGAGLLALRALRRWGRRG